MFRESPRYTTSVSGTPALKSSSNSAYTSIRGLLSNRCMKWRMKLKEEYAGKYHGALSISIRNRKSTDKILRGRNNFSFIPDSREIIIEPIFLIRLKNFSHIFPTFRNEPNFIIQESVNGLTGRRDWNSQGSLPAADKKQLPDNLNHAETLIPSVSHAAFV